jgi:uncharacterized protein with PIN domain
MEFKFLLDGMLGSLTRWLRICGYDSEYRKDLQDILLIEEAKNNNRILLTRDKTLVKQARKSGVRSYYIEGANLVERLKLLIHELGLNLTPSNSRCPRCNGNLNKVEKNRVKHIVPKKSLDNFENFWQCSNCDSVFWKGSHWDNIIRTIKIASTDYCL